MPLHAFTLPWRFASFQKLLAAARGESSSSSTQSRSTATRSPQDGPTVELDLNLNQPLESLLRDVNTQVQKVLRGFMPQTIPPPPPPSYQPMNHFNTTHATTEPAKETFTETVVLEVCFVRIIYATLNINGKIFPNWNGKIFPNWNGKIFPHIEMGRFFRIGMGRFFCIDMGRFFCIEMGRFFRIEMRRFFRIEMGRFFRIEMGRFFRIEMGRFFRIEMGRFFRIEMGRFFWIVVEGFHEVASKRFSWIRVEMCWRMEMEDVFPELIGEDSSEWTLKDFRFEN